MLPRLIDEMKNSTEDEFVYLNWNGFFILIHKNSTIDGCMNQYYEEIRKDRIYNDYNCKTLISKQELAEKIVTLLTNLEKL